MFGLFVYVNFRLGGNWIGSLLLPDGWSASSSCRRDSAAIWFLALGNFDSSLTNARLLEVSAVLRNVIRIYLLSSSTRSISEGSGVGIVEVPLFYIALVTNHDILVRILSLCVRILSHVKNWNAHRIDPFVVISWSFDHSLRQCGDRIRIRMIDISLMNWLLHPSIQFNVSATLRLLLSILIVFHVHILLNLSQVLLSLWNHRFQLRWRESRSILHVRKLQNIGLTAIGKLTASLQWVVDTITNRLIGFSVILLWIILSDWISRTHHVSLHACLSIEAR